MRRFVFACALAGLMVGVAAGFASAQVGQAQGNKPALSLQQVRRAFAAEGIILDVVAAPRAIRSVAVLRPRQPLPRTDYLLVRVRSPKSGASASNFRALCPPAPAVAGNVAGERVVGNVTVSYELKPRLAREVEAAIERLARLALS